MYVLFLERETAHKVQWTLVLRGPEWNGELEPSSPGLDSNKRGCKKTALKKKSLRP